MKCWTRVLRKTAKTEWAAGWQPKLEQPFEGLENWFTDRLIMFRISCFASNPLPSQRRTTLGNRRAPSLIEKCGWSLKTGEVLSKF